MSRQLILVFVLLGQLIAEVNKENLNTKLLFKARSRRQTLSPAASASANLALESCKEEANFKAIPSPARRSQPSASGGLRPTCDPWDSCETRCGQSPIGLPFTCNCDLECVSYQDCCVDFESECSSLLDAVVVKENQTRPVCRNLLPFPPWYVYVVSACHASYDPNSAPYGLCKVDLPSDCIGYRMLEGFSLEEVLQKCRDTSFSECKTIFQPNCNATVEPRCTDIINNECRRRSRRHCQKCGDSYWPVLADDGLLYKNAHCAACNAQSSYRSLPLGRIATDMMGTNHHNLATLCSRFLSPVLSSDILYKNAYCGLCNGVENEEMECPDFSLSLSGNAPQMFYSFFNLNMMDNDVTLDMVGAKVESLPAAFSILLNFGLDGRERMLFSSECEEELRRHQKLCGAGYIWDPFSKICRKLFCSTEFVLQNFRCVKKPDAVPIDENHNSTNVPNTKSNFVHLSLSAEVEILDFLQFLDHDNENITQSIRESLASSFNISEDRLKNVRFNITVGNFSNLNETLRFIHDEMEDNHPIIFVIDFDLYETLDDNIPQPSVDSIVSMLASALSVEGFEFDVSNVRGRIFEIHQTVDMLQSWCTPGRQIEYWNSDFSLIMDENSTLENRVSGVYINKTSKFYSKGQFVANILFQGYQFSDSLINVSGVVVVCDEKKELNTSCTRVQLKRDEYTILENGTLSIGNASQNSKVIDDSAYEEGENDTIVVCLQSHMTKDFEDIYYLDMDIIEVYTSAVLLYVSVIAMAAVLLTYCLFSSLRNLPGCNTMNLTFALLVMQLTFLVGQRSTVTGDWCKGVAHFFHYDLLCSFTWMNVMAFDLYKTFGTSSSVLCNVRSKSKHLPRYMAYAYGTPVVVILVTFLLDFLASESDFAPHYGHKNVCWITSKTAAISFFATPLAIIMAVNFSFYVLTIRAIRNVKHVSYLTDQKKHRRGHSDVLLYARMALVTGLTWALAFAAAYVRAAYLTYLFLIFNNLQGLFLFFVFVCNRRVFELYRAMFKQSGCSGGSNVVIGTVSRVARVMKRSVSTDTVTSTISNSSSTSDSALQTIQE